VTVSRWQALAWPHFVAEVVAALAVARRPGTGPSVLSVDGRSASGKTTVADRLVAAVPGAGLVHSDDLAWYDSVLAWDHLLVGGVLAPLRRGEEVRFRPPAWRERGREGAVRVPAGTDLLVLEGVGTSRRSLSDVVTLAVWVETPEPVRWQREEDRVAAGEVSREVQRSWVAREDAHLRVDEPWSRARWVVSGDPGLPLGAASDIGVLRSSA